MSNAAWSASPTSGVRDQITGYALVNSLSDLKQVASDLAGNYALGKDIDASASSDLSYMPLGNVDTPFIGQFNGFGHQITNLTLSKSVAGDHGQQGEVLQAQGLFGFIGASARVGNLSLNAAVDAPIGAGGDGMYGLLAGINAGTITQSFATGRVIEPNPPDNPNLLPAGGTTTTNTGTIGNDVYWNKDTTGASIGVYSGTQMPAANGLTTAQMSDPASFVGYDFGPNRVWTMPAGATHPVLSWQVGH